ncbi:MAG: hypothetical protein BWY26_01123 [Elusimicrobia bacterium ADurb.Bin231]|nr:MAG: hypothetical protein BWY26_01123 [Elusimicrobia bacterium ADurb.Bin231]
MKNRHSWLCQTVFFVLVLASILLPPPAYCYIEYLNPEVVDHVEVTLVVEPTSGPVPLSVKFTSTAKAVIHYADEVDENEGGGSVDPREPLYKDKELTPKKPDDQTIKDPGTYTFTATAKYGGKEGKATVTVVVKKTLPEGIDVKDDANVDNLSDEMIEALEQVVEVWDDNNAPTPVITSGNDGEHGEGSLHYEDEAVDLRGNNVSDEEMQQLADDLQEALGDDYDVIAEFFPDDPDTEQDESLNDHIHVEYDPR